MNARWAAVRAGLRRGWIEFKQTYTNADSLVPALVVSVGFIVVMLLTRTTTVPGTHFSLGTTMLTGVLGMSVGINGLASMGAQLAIEREDGTLLRAKAIPNGMAGYLIGKIIAISLITLIGIAAALIPGLFLFKGLAVGSATAWLTLIWVLLLGLVATLPIGAVLGSLLPSARSAGLITLGTGAIVAISGIFYPITHLPYWLQWAGQVFPFYWLGLGMRSALLPASLAVVEIGHSWRHLETFGVLLAWAIVGLAVAPVLLRRMARRESGSSVAARREKALLRVG
jgi:ABC-2 type transport system permease protein